MLDGDAPALVLLHAAHGRRCDLAREDGVFRAVLEGAAAERVPKDVHAGRQPDGDAELLHLLPHRVAEALHEGGVPRLRADEPARPCRRILIVADAVFGLGEHFCAHHLAEEAEVVLRIGLRALERAVGKFDDLGRDVEPLRAVGEDDVGDRAAFIEFRRRGAACAHHVDEALLPSHVRSHEEKTELLFGEGARKGGVFVVCGRQRRIAVRENGDGGKIDVEDGHALILFFGAGGRGEFLELPAEGTDGRALFDELFLPHAEEGDGR